MGKLLTDEDLLVLRGIEESVMAQTAEIWRKGEVDDGAGGFRSTLVLVENSPCWMGPIGNSPQELAIAARLTGKMLYRIKLPAGADSDRNDQITIDGETYDVIEPVHQTFETARVLVCVKVD